MVTCEVVPLHCSPTAAESSEKFEGLQRSRKSFKLNLVFFIVQNDLLVFVL